LHAVPAQPALGQAQWLYASPVPNLAWLYLGFAGLGEAKAQLFAHSWLTPALNRARGKAFGEICWIVNGLCAIRRII